MKILTITIKKKLCWNKKTKEEKTFQKVIKQLMIVKKLQICGASTEELVDLWNIYCTKVQEQSDVVWSSSLLQENMFQCIFCGKDSSHRPMIIEVWP